MLGKTRQLGLFAGLLSVLLFAACEKKDFQITDIEPHAGVVSGGEPVKIKGSGFAAGMGVTVYFGNIKAPAVVVDSQNLMSVTTPPGKSLGPVDIRVIMDDGREYVLKRNFQYVKAKSLQMFNSYDDKDRRRSPSTPTE